MHLRSLAVALVATLLVPAIGRAQPGSDLVDASLLADADRVLPGATITLGVRLDIEEDWHVYWLNPGDSGMPPVAEFDLPSGFEMTGSVRFPGPRRFDLEGGLVNYGYEDELVMLYEVTAPDPLPELPSFRFAADVEWLVCRDVCLPGGAKTHLDLPGPVSPSAPDADPENRIEATKARLPRPIEEAERIGARWISETADRPVLQVTVHAIPEDAATDFFPYEGTNGYVLVDEVSMWIRRHLRRVHVLTFSADEPGRDDPLAPKPADAVGVFAITTGEGDEAETRYFEVPVPESAETGPDPAHDAPTDP